MQKYCKLKHPAAVKLFKYYIFFEKSLMRLIICGRVQKI